MIFTRKEWVAYLVEHIDGDGEVVEKFADTLFNEVSKEFCTSKDGEAAINVDERMLQWCSGHDCNAYRRHHEGNTGK